MPKAPKVFLIRAKVRYTRGELAQPSDLAALGLAGRQKPNALPDHHRRAQPKLIHQPRQRFLRIRIQPCLNSLHASL